MALMVLLAGILISAPSRTAMAQQVECTAPERIRDSEDSRQVRAGLTELVQAVAACQTAGDYETMSRLVSQKYLGKVYGGGPSMSRATFLELAKSFPPTRVRFRDFEDFRLNESEALASVKLIVGNQLTLDRMTFIESNTAGAWLIDSAETRKVEPPRDHDDVRITIRDNRYDPAALTAEGANIELVVKNEDEVDHEVLVLRLDEGIDASSLADEHRARAATRCPLPGPGDGAGWKQGVARACHHASRQLCARRSLAKRSRRAPPRLRHGRHADRHRVASQAGLHNVAGVRPRSASDRGE